MDHADKMTTAYLRSVIELELPKLPGWCSTEKGYRLAELAMSVPAKLCVELGVFGGRSLVAIALGLAHNGFGQVTGVDPFTQAASLEGTNDPANDEWWSHLDYEAIARAAQTGIYELDLTEYAHLVRMRSLEVVDFYKNESIDLLHQDSNHAEEISCEEVARWAPKISPNGYWIADDTNWESTKKAQRDLEALGFTELEDHGTWKVYRNKAQQ